MFHTIQRLYRVHVIEEGFIAPVTTSLPRDCLQAERSLLLFCKMSGVLAMVSLALILDFDLSNETIKGHAPHFANRAFSKAVGILFFVLSMASLLLGAFNYFQNIYHYFGQRRFTGPKKPTSSFLALIVLTLLAVNITLLVDSKYWNE